jgi:hypothetical protein
MIPSKPILEMLLFVGGNFPSSLDHVAWDPLFIIIIAKWRILATKKITVNPPQVVQGPVLLEHSQN